MAGAIARRLAAIEARLPRPPEPDPPPELAWLEMLTTDELVEIEEMYARAAREGRPGPTETDELRCLELHAKALREMVAGLRPAWEREAEERRRRFGPVLPGQS
jgi:hypothetical protein